MRELRGRLGNALLLGKDLLHRLVVLIQGHRRLRRIGKSARGGSYAPVQDGRCVDVNWGACKLFGRTRDELLDLHLWEIAGSPPEAWRDALRLVRELEVDAIEIAQFDFFKTWDASDDDVRALGAEIAGAGLTCNAMQGILYQAPNVHLFASTEARAALRAHLGNVARIAALLGAKACVFGAPKQRDPGALTGAQAWDVAIDFFRTVAPMFADQGAALIHAYGVRPAPGSLESDARPQVRVTLT